MEPESMREIAQRASGFARWVVGTAVVLQLAAGPARAQTPPVLDPVLVAAERFLTSPSALLRGEAGLAVATSRLPRFYDGLRRLAEDPEANARHRGMLALGILGHPGADIVLARVRDRAARGSSDRVVAALALGLLPDEPRLAILDDFFNEVGGASQRRVGEELVAVLMGLGTSPHPSRRTALHRLLDNAAWRHRPVLGLVLENLGRDAGSPEALLEYACAAEPALAITALRGLHRPGIEIDAKRHRELMRVARSSRNPAVRAAALDLFVFRRDPDGLDLARQAMQHDAPELLAAGVRAILHLGGGALRESLEDRILASDEPAELTAMLAAKSGPHTDRFIERCLVIAAREAEVRQVRVQAAAIVAEAGWKEVVPLLIDLFLTATESEELATLARALQSAPGEIVGRIHPPRTPEDAGLLPMRVRSLDLAGNDAARALLRTWITDADTPGELRIEGLRSYRLAHQPRFSALAQELAPAVLHELLGY